VPGNEVSPQPCLGVQTRVSKAAVGILLIKNGIGIERGDQRNDLHLRLKAKGEEAMPAGLGVVLPGWEKLSGRKLDRKKVSVIESREGLDSITVSTTDRVSLTDLSGKRAEVGRGRRSANDAEWSWGRKTCKNRLKTYSGREGAGGQT